MYVHSIGVHVKHRAVLWYCAQLAENKTAQCVKIQVFWNIHAYCFGNLLYVGAAANTPQIRLYLLHFLRFRGVKLVIYVSNYLLKQILHCNKAGGIAILVNNNGYMNLFLLHILHKRRGLKGIRNKIGRTQNFA